MTSLLAAEAGTAAVSFPVLTAMVLTPFLGAIFLLVLPNNRPEYFKQVAFLVSALTAAMTGWVMIEFDKAQAATFQFVDQFEWIESLGISWALGLDGISLWLVVLTGALFPIVILALDAEHSPKPYYAWILVLQAGCMGVFLALDLFAFFVFFEIVLVPMYFLIGQWGHGERAYAATKFFIYTMMGSALMLVGIISTAVITANTTGNDLTFGLIELAEAQALATNTARWVFLSFALAFAVKVPLFPLHTWLPDAHTNAPTAGSVILAGVMLKLGTYGFLRFGIYLFPEAAVYFAAWLVALGTIGIIYGAVAATMQRDLKRLVAYSSVAHLGFIVIGTFALNTEGIEGGLLQMVNHGVSTGALFLLVGMIYERRHTREISELGGLQKPAPILAGVFMVVMLSSVGLPGLNGFVGEFLTLIGAFAAHRWWAVVAASGVIIAALYLLWAYQRVFHGSAEGDNATMPDLTVREGLTMVPFLVAIVFMGVYPKPVIERMEPAVDALVAHVETHVEGFEEPVADIAPHVELEDLSKLGTDGHGEEDGGHD
ncbi:MAG: NADH-quinone oxidoreductase subunit M [Acidimicrobiales bacterium]|nr:NADH-quinone oxidoreductase subunit M [Acidimicrobiales bacterium]MDG2218514.1 NADH-quinone oxidoreductase subunit M [Acidimicrobiales bacterium]